MLAKRKALGRGLGALIKHADKTGDSFSLCPIEDINPSSVQPRKIFHEQQLQELAESIKEKGIIEPLLVRKAENGYELIAGERRWRAAKLAGLRDVPVVVRDATDEESLELAIIENIQRENLNAIEEAAAYKNLMERFELSQEEVAKKIGKERATVANFLRLLKLPDEVKEELKNGIISMGHAKVLLSLDSHVSQREVCRRIVQKGLSVRETEELVKYTVSSSKKSASLSRKKNAYLSAIENELRNIFGTKVIVKNKKGKGRIEIEFYSNEELERILDTFRNIKT
ncbi:MAG: chromosome partitioning protein ParB [Deltaproteobacteria bacterium GWC2_42_51]|nr:MAG: chromosome partitioning protein ParB [Deltaproteobacteria bacterium GWB2_42_7]OGP35944.1 MAG: chromosome partitioning protein ParB [Deltaproteobacteria bacterium GWC2_42_51]OGP38060.1 MAG: chromosome partitioning protein ParB [Deltaproteobacteria bacterium GWD2_42_10]OGP47604.1 MAG: chromosome partitioning protein ParB [Deltaproteobacteria bacterium GWF2_42_12]OGQ25911.1 MAG: chromosome partitioning protein ParB [Deltaproteobacteria bacterium RIFCSPHIGHO2_02_FULL_42_44]OGQ37585.1 MAG: 